MTTGWSGLLKNLSLNSLGENGNIVIFVKSEIVTGLQCPRVIFVTITTKKD